MLQNVMFFSMKFGFLLVYEVVPFDRPYTTFYWSATTNIAAIFVVADQ